MGMRARPILLWGCLAALLATGCLATVPPVTKIGLIAHFEGLYRPSGYAALEGLTAATIECPVPGRGYLPLALDASLGPDATPRAQAKIARDPSVGFILGPVELDGLWQSHAAGPARSVSATPQLLPALLHPDGRFAELREWPEALAYFIAAVTTQPPADASWTELIVVIPAGENSEDAALHHRLVQTVADYAPPGAAAVHVVAAGGEAEIVQAVAGAYAQGAAILWPAPQPGDSQALVALSRRFPDAAFIFGPAAGPVLLSRHLDPRVRRYWAVWTDDGYTEWAMRHGRTGSLADPLSLQSYLVFRAACMPMLFHAGEPPASSSWRLRIVALHDYD